MTTTLYRGGRVRSSADPFATALLVDGATVAWVGSDTAAAALGADEVVDLDDAWVAPAFVDAHVHATSTGLALTGLDLTGVPSLTVALDRVGMPPRRRHDRPRAQPQPAQRRRIRLAVQPHRGNAAAPIDVAQEHALRGGLGHRVEGFPRRPNGLGREQHPAARMTATNANATSTCRSTAQSMRAS